MFALTLRQRTTASSDAWLVVAVLGARPPAAGPPAAAGLARATLRRLRLVADVHAVIVDQLVRHARREYVHGRRAPQRAVLEEPEVFGAPVVGGIAVENRKELPAVVDVLGGLIIKEKTTKWKVQNNNYMYFHSSNKILRQTYNLFLKFLNHVYKYARKKLQQSFIILLNIDFSSSLG